MKTSAWILGDQLTFEHPALHAQRRADTVVVMIESLPRAEARPWHRQKLVLVWSAMRHFASELRDRGYEVDYYRLQSGLRTPLKEHLRRAQSNRLLLMETAEYGRAGSLASLAASVGAKVQVLDNMMFISDREAFAMWAEGRKQLVMESFYHDMRRKTGFLMDDDQPVGGQWNLDRENRQVPPEDVVFPPVPTYDPDSVTSSVLDEVRERFPKGFGKLRGFRWPVTAEQAEAFFLDFLTERLDCFGPYEDAMVVGQRALCHSLLSPLLNIGLLSPREVCRQVAERYESGAARLNSVEGFVRQVIGWREFVYQVYHRFMPDYRASNVFGADIPLPAFYWDGDTQMRCVAEAVATLQEHGMNHHIQRLMITGNFALIAGVDPQAVNAWYYLAYVDAYDWVVTPNVLGMALFADGGVLATKPYAASANYINKMSDYCPKCAYDHRAATGSDSCPFNALYWDFLARHEDQLRELAPRMNLMLAALNRRPKDNLDAILQRADELRAGLRRGDRF